MCVCHKYTRLSSAVSVQGNLVHIFKFVYCSGRRSKHIQMEQCSVSTRKLSSYLQICVLQWEEIKTYTRRSSVVSVQGNWVHIFESVNCSGRRSKHILDGAVQCQYKELSSYLQICVLQWEEIKTYTRRSSVVSVQGNWVHIFKSTYCSGRRSKHILDGAV